jgi:hypothetical protein
VRRGEVFVTESRCAGGIRRRRGSGRRVK